ncbi:hypothetical protein AAZX31_02G274500 [Glycine max]|uniref:Senescence regulator n=2 Tax=Glycine subgen. Soja TaxID=1462606 RepID=C6TKI1_SOYBN|nr:uncharacterized protein LOC100796494 [Glycine max]XP_006574427.1 uncharacterized protein LOC100796494 isoform X1 [Glycine max]XP_028220675.1 uncharacterized protein LOC114402344 [Glycine soja]XP_028220684.1 uncharacterized protein LOC114402344 [Glycine soja]ACU23421.1 unknown [Glycine max]KAG5053377.1 hypothetical protein JHK87_005575 [Glycine soja]KAG5081670.1 hypothetical protein JHK86_005735 [Glycine max]KAH1062688.1 hypothetical protein GYH30_005576 [Glycine max]KAH1263723.1 hypothet|eukprot:NP_001240052.1 uncharacterized protein LOC100796494 [Glycine max]
MEDKYSLGRQHSGIWKSLRDGEFDEEEVWDVFKNRSDYGSSSSGVRKFKDKGKSSSVPARPSSARMIPRSSNSSNNSSASSSNEAKVLQQSAPVNIPDWSKIYRTKTPKNSVSRFDDDYDGDGAANYGGDSDEDGEENDESDSKLPPHEFIARRLARSRISSFSVLEGAGRTLKGRDLSKVRNDVLSKTGFLESL